MILRLLGWAFRAIGRLRGGEAGTELAHVGAELCRLEEPPAQSPATAR
jgi:hypothetical protein